MMRRRRRRAVRLAGALAGALVGSLWAGVWAGVWAFPAAAQQPAEPGTGALLRGLDKIDGTVTDFDLPIGGIARLGDLQIALRACRHPLDDPAGDAYAWLTIRDSGDAVLFAGWMLASSPALNALEHRRYDVWVLRCRTA